MAIRYWKEKQIFSIDTKNTTYQMKVDSYGFLLHLYYGAKVNGAKKGNITYRVCRQFMQKKTKRKL